MIGNNRYSQFLNSYISYKVNREIGDDRSNYAQKNLEIVDRELKSEVRDFYLTTQLCLTLDRNRKGFNEELIDRIHNDVLKNFLINRLHSKPFLPNGTDIPYFKLVGHDNE